MQFNRSTNVVFRRALALVCVFMLAVTANRNAAAQQAGHLAESSENMVATVNPIATDVAVKVLDSGGNAIDAAIAAGLMLSVVDGFNSGIGGGCFILIRTADGKIHAIDGREMAPAKAHRDMYLVDGKPDTSLSQTGSLAIGVPGALKAYEQAVNEYGNKKFADLVKPAAEVARKGFDISSVYAGRANGSRELLSRFPGSKAILIKQDGTNWTMGDRLIQSDLANTLDNIANQGTDYFYGGEFASETASWMESNKGIISVADFTNYHTKKRTPVETTYRGYTIVGFPPPSSGGFHVAQILNILENFDLKHISDTNKSEFVHIIAEAMKLAFADRAYWLGDPDFAKVPMGLIDKNYAAELAKRIDSDKVCKVDSHGTPPLKDSKFFERHTTHIAAADKHGNWVAITTTNNTSFGSKVIIPGLGVVMNNQMDDFSIAPGTPNAYGLVGTESNSVQPGKRPLSSMSPTIILKDGNPVMTVGAAGGPKIITQALLATIRHLDLGMSVDEAVSRKRFHHQWSPDILMLEEGFDPELVEALKTKGHKVRIVGAAGISQAIIHDATQGIFSGAHDPRTPGKAAGSQKVKR